MATYIVDVVKSTVHSYRVEDVESQEEAEDRYSDHGVIIHSDASETVAEVRLES